LAELFVGNDTMRAMTPCEFRLCVKN
jgi:hypothetical protein